MFLSKTEQNILNKSFRKFIYIALTVCFTFFLHFLASIYHGETFEECGVAENLQFVMLIISGGIFLFNAFKNPTFRAVMFWLASLCAWGAVRELDRYFDETLPIISWKFGFLFPLAALAYAYKHRQAVRKTIFIFFNSAAFDMMLTAVIIGLPVAQLIGHRPLVANVLGTERLADIKQLFEECAETIGYFLILLSAVESFIGLKRNK